MTGTPGRSFILYQGADKVTYQDYEAQDGNTIVDVYKRQLWGRKLIWRRCGNSWSAAPPAEMPIPHPVRRQTCPVSVSYTHLDVYKRQRQKYGCFSAQ